MPALDFCHENIVHALEKNGWSIDSSPQQFVIEDRLVYIELQASQYTNGSRDQILLAEIKCFPDRDSTTRELYIAMGQYIIYRAVLAELRNTTPLYLAIPEAVYLDIFDVSVRRAISDNQIKVVIVNIIQEQIVQWIK